MRNVFIAVDVQRDFCEKGSLAVPKSTSLIDPLNKGILQASDIGMLIIFTRDWHPENHCSFEENGGCWPRHCVQNNAGAELHPDLIVPSKSIIVDKGTASDTEGYSPYENPLMKKLIDQPDVNRVYITGIALEYCVRATCLDTVKLGKEAVLVEPLVLSTSQDAAVVEGQWDELTRAGVIRAQGIGR